MRQALSLIVTTLAVVDGRRHRYGAGSKVPERSPLPEEQRQLVPDRTQRFLRELVQSFKANEEAETLRLPASMSQSERQLVHIYAAREGLGHKSVGMWVDRCLVLSKDDAWVRRRRRYIRDEMSDEDPEELVAKSRKHSGPFGSGPMQYCWLGAVAFHYTCIM